MFDVGLLFSSEELGEVAASIKNCVTEEDLLKDDLKKSRVEERKEDDEEGGVPEGVEPQAAQSKAEKMKEEEEVDDGQPEEYIIGEVHQTQKWKLTKV